MDNLLQEIFDLKQELKQKKEKLKEIVSKIKNEISDRYYSNRETRTFFHALFLITGNYYDWYDKNISRSIYLSAATQWKTNAYLNHYNLFKYIRYDRFGYGQEARSIGFVCFKKDLYHAIFYQIEEIWKDRVLKRGYKESLETFKENLSKNPETCYLVFCDYCENNSHTLLTINYPILKIKNVIVYSNEKL